MEETPDPFEVALGTWAAEDHIVRYCRQIAEDAGLNPALAEDLADSFLMDDQQAQDEALAAFFRALREALTTPP